MAGYDFQLVVKDIYNTSTALDDMPTKEVFLDINETTGSMGFGGEASDDASVVRYDFYAPVYFQNGAVGQMVYTGAEKDTGLRWIDGKPIYCMTFRGAQSAGGDGNGYVIGTIDDLAEVVRFDGYIKRADSGTIMPLNYPYFNNSQQMTAVNIADGGGVRIIKGSAWTPEIYVVSVLYTKTTDAPMYYYLPFLTANSDQGCVASASSVYNANNEAYKAFNGIILGSDSWWGSTQADTDRWVQVQMPYALRNMVVTLIDRDDVSDNHLRANTAGAFLGSNDGSAWTELASFEGRNPNFENSFATMYELNNATAYTYLRYRPAGYTSTLATSVADLRIEGEVVDA